MKCCCMFFLYYCVLTVHLCKSHIISKHEQNSGDFHCAYMVQNDHTGIVIIIEW